MRPAWRSVRTASGTTCWRVSTTANCRPRWPDRGRSRQPPAHRAVISYPVGVDAYDARVIAAPVRSAARLLRLRHQPLAAGGTAVALAAGRRGHMDDAWFAALRCRPEASAIRRASASVELPSRMYFFILVHRARADPAQVIRNGPVRHPVQPIALVLAFLCCCRRATRTRRRRRTCCRPSSSPRCSRTVNGWPVARSELTTFGPAVLAFLVLSHVAATRERLLSLMGVFACAARPRARHRTGGTGEAGPASACRRAHPVRRHLQRSQRSRHVVPDRVADGRSCPRGGWAACADCSGGAQRRRSSTRST